SGTGHALLPHAAARGCQASALAAARGVGAALAAAVQRRLHVARTEAGASLDARTSVSPSAAASRGRRARRADDACARADRVASARASRAFMKVVQAFTDGACRGNPGPGGWGVLLRSGAHEKELSGGEP